MRASGRLVGIAGNQSAALEEWARSLGLPVDVVTSSARLGVRKPDPAFFARLVELSGRVADEVAYVGDRVDNDVLPALERGPRRRPRAPRPVGPAAARRRPQASGSRSTTSRSLPSALALAPWCSRAPDELRIGLGVDAHAFGDGVPLVLGGVAIDHPRGLAGHSDGDVIAHALTDALLGAAGLADIGALFPSDDERYRGADSLAPARRGLPARPARRVRARQRRLRADRRGAADRAASRGDARAPRGRARRRRRMRVNVRATTTDRLGFTGRGEGLAAEAVALLRRDAP